MTAPIKSPKKLIEVALPLDAINVASAREKSIRHGHPSTLHLWWARRPLAAARAVIFAQMVNDLGGERGYFAGMTKAQAAAKREELFKIIEELVLWGVPNNRPLADFALAGLPVEILTHTETTRKNFPTAEFQSVMKSEEEEPVRVCYPPGTQELEAEKVARIGDLDHQLEWRCAEAQDWSDLMVRAPLAARSFTVDEMRRA